MQVIKVSKHHFSHRNTRFTLSAESTVTTDRISVGGNTMASVHLSVHAFVCFHSILVTRPNTCELDPIPTWLLKQLASYIAPVIRRLCNLSLEQGVFPVQLKEARILPLLKKMTSHCYGCEQSLANVRSVMPAPPHGTTCLKTCAPRQTQRSSENSWRLTFLVALLMFNDV